MDLRRRLIGWSLGRPRVLLVDAPGSRALRWSVEGELDRRGWPLALSPADVDLLLVLGAPGPELSAAVDRLWRQTPAPRHRLDVGPADAPGAVLDAARAALLTGAWGGTSVPPPGPWSEDGAMPDHEDMDHKGMDHEGMDHGSGQRTGMAEMEHGGHGQHGGGGGHEGQEMHHGGTVAGLAMAGTAPDRDGLELDSLAVSLGPVMPGWPTGLVLRGQMQGDVLTGVEVSWADGTPVSTPVGAASSHRRAAALDSLSRFLVVAGWPSNAATARAARTGLLSTEPLDADRGQRAASRLARRVRGARSLAWSVHGIGGTGGGDALARVRHWCDVAAGRDAPGGPVTAVTMADLAGLVEGAELATARLAVASVDLEPGPGR